MNYVSLNVYSQIYSKGVQEVTFISHMSLTVSLRSSSFSLLYSSI